MGNSNPPLLNNLSVQDIERIDSICEQYEQSWLAGNPANISQLISSFHGDFRVCLVSELIKLDIDYRRGEGQTPTEKDYLSRFASDSAAIVAAFDSMNHRDTARLSTTKERGDGSQLAKLLSPIQLSSDYELLEMHAHGGLGEIYIAWDKRLSRKVAVKIPRDRNANSRERMRLRREAEITSQLKHPGIVPVHAANFEDGQLPCYIMQLIEGQTLREAVRAFHSKPGSESDNPFRKWEFRRLIQRLITVCNTVAYGHDHGVIHRDIKPVNIMLGSFGETFLLDWGLAKIIEIDERSDSAPTKAPVSKAEQDSWRDDVDETAKTRPGQPIGTPEFASPEQISGRIEEHDVRSDVYSLGATMYYLLVGKRPVELEDLTDLGSPVAIKRIKPPRTVNHDVPLDLDAICMKALAYEASDRYQLVTGLANDLERFLADEPVHVRKQGLAVRLRRWTTKNPRWASGIVTGMLVAVTALCIGAWMLSQKNVELRQSNVSLTKSNYQLDFARKKTTEILRTITDQAMQEFLGREQYLHDQDRNLLNQLLSEYQSFAESFAEDERSIEIEMEANFRIGQIQKLLGKTKEASQSMQRALELFARLPGNHSVQARHLEAIATNKSGDYLFQLGEKELGLQLLKTSTTKFDELQKDFPEDPKRQFLAAKSRLSLGIAQHELRQHAAAKETFGSAVEILRSLLEQDPENAEYLQSLGNFLTNLGIVNSRLGKLKASIDQCREALQAHSRLKDLGVDKLNFHLERVKTKLNLGILLKQMKQGAQSEARYREVVDECTQLTERFPNVPVNFITLSMAQQYIGQIHMYRDELNESIKHNQFAVRAAESAVTLEPDLEKYSYTLFTSRMSLAVALRLNGDLEKTTDVYEQCLETGTQLFEEHGDLKYRVGLARAYHAYAKLKVAQDNLTDAITLFEQSVRLLESSSEAEKRNGSLRKLWRSSSKSLAQKLMAAVRNPEAVKHWDRVIELTDGSSLFAQTVRAVCTADANPSLALQRVDEILELGPENGLQFYNLASASARAARFMESGDDQRELAMDKAFDLLTLAADRGHFSKKASIERFKSNNSFTWMKDDPRLQGFWKKLENLAAKN